MKLIASCLAFLLITSASYAADLASVDCSAMPDAETITLCEQTKASPTLDTDPAQLNDFFAQLPDCTILPEDQQASCEQAKQIVTDNKDTNVADTDVDAVTSALNDLLQGNAALSGCITNGVDCQNGDATACAYLKTNCTAAGVE